ncbi:RNA 2',3'-cyclic phosphodiesterase [Virgibacillus sp. Bac330]|uniref:RNA 2',3'-cyclic phosphodiesterase n=1 Tax=Virgibacillus sp. Bac330 TaxID=2419841 RepID=UPI000EF4F5A4|nr:RNA 2',3'-cyclic phosphodiesterase [Virgibacillus sp. Bac330]
MARLPHYFIAIPLTKEVQVMCSETQTFLKQKLPYREWTIKHDFHITLKFLGPVSDSKVCHLIDRLQRVHFSPFYLKVGGVDTFGSFERPRVIYSKVQLNDTLTKLVNQIEFEAKAEGFLAEKRPYIPHITLAKKWDGSAHIGNEVLTEVKNKDYSEKLLYVDYFVLYQIFPDQQPKYKVKAYFTL